MGRIKQLTQMISEGRVGFKMDEAMIGEHRFESGCGPDGWHPMQFRVSWGPRTLHRFLNPFDEDCMSTELEGHVDIDYLCHNAPCRGHFELLYFSEHRIRYHFDFEAQGRAHRYVGEKVNIKPWNLATSHTTCFGTVVETDTGKLISRSVTYFKMHTLPGFLWSLRLA